MESLDGPQEVADTDGRVASEFNAFDMMRDEKRRSAIEIVKSTVRSSLKHERPARVQQHQIAKHGYSDVH